MDSRATKTKPHLHRVKNQANQLFTKIWAKTNKLPHPLFRVREARGSHYPTPPPPRPPLKCLRSTIYTRSRALPDAHVVQGLVLLMMVDVLSVHFAVELHVRHVHSLDASLDAHLVKVLANIRLDLVAKNAGGGSGGGGLNNWVGN